MKAPQAPDDCITFSHEDNAWLASWWGAWVRVTVREARALFDKGWKLLEEL